MPRILILFSTTALFVQIKFLCSSVCRLPRYRANGVGVFVGTLYRTTELNGYMYRESPKILNIQSTLVISNLKGPSETLRDIRTSTYQIFRMEENTNRTTKFNK